MLSLEKKRSALKVHFVTGINPVRRMLVGKILELPISREQTSAWLILLRYDATDLVCKSDDRVIYGPKY